VAVRIRLTEVTDTIYSFYLQRNIYNIYTTENSLEHVVPVASLHHHVRLRACSTVCVCPRPTACRFYMKAGCLRDISHIVHLHMRTVTYTTTVNHRQPPAHQTRVHCSRRLRRVVQCLDRDNPITNIQMQISIKPICDWSIYLTVSADE